MTSSEFELRLCPACGADAPTLTVSSEPRAEDLTFAELRPFWSGLFSKKIFFSYARCGKCAQMYAPRFFSDAQLGELYADMAPNMEDVPGPALKATQRGYWEMAKRRAPTTGGYLEIGPDIGYIVREAVKGSAFDHYWLFEPNEAVHESLANAAGPHPHSISTNMTDLSPVPDGSVSLAVMVHVLDHLLDPLTILEQIRRKLRAGGVLMIVTHNEQSLLRRAMGLKFPPFCLQHPELYNPQSIARLLSRAHYGQVQVKRSKNYFPIAFMVRQAGWTAGLDLSKLPLPEIPLGLKLGNMLTLARVMN